MFIDNRSICKIATLLCGSFCNFLIWVTSLTMGIVYGIFYFDDHRQTAWPIFIGSAIAFGTSTLFLLFLVGWLLRQHYKENQLTYETI